MLSFEGQKSTRCGQFLATSYTVEDGLPTNLVKDILQDKRGFVWLATDAGLVRFDGFRFISIIQDLPSQYVKRVFMRRNGQLLALTDLGLVEIISTLDSVRIRTILGGSPVEQKNALHYAKAMYEDTQNNLWFFEKQAVVCWKDNKLTRYKLPEKCNSTNVALTFSLADDGAGNLILSSFQGFCFRYNVQTDSFDEIELPQNYGTFSHCIALRSGEFIIAAEKGLLRISFQQNTIQQNTIQQNSTSPTPTPSTKSSKNLTSLVSSSNQPIFLYKEAVSGVNKISSLFISSKSLFQPSGVYSPTIYIGTNYGGILTTDTSFTAITPIPNLLPQRIKNFSEDLFGNIWVCGDQGVIFLEQAMMKFVEGFNLSAPDVGVTTKAPDGTIFTLNGEALYAINPHTTTARLVMEKPSNSALLYAVYADSKGDVWVGSLSGLLVQLHNGIVVRSVQLSINSTERGIFSLTEDKTGNIWGCVFSNRVSAFCFSPNSGNIHYYGVEQGLTTTAQVIRTSQDGTLYVGTSGSAEEYLLRYNPANDRFDNIGPPLQSMVNYKLNIYDIAPDPTNERTFWLASSAGLLRIEGEQASLPLAADDGLNNISGKAVITQKNGIVWMGTDNGIIRYAPHIQQAERAAFLQQPAGLMTRTISYRGFCLDKEEVLWVATNNGLYSLNTNIYTSLETQMPCLVQASINGKSIHFAALPTSFSAEEYIQLYFSVFVPSPHTVCFRSRMYLENTTKPAWSRPSQEPTLSLSNLEAGTYIIEIAARREGMGELWSKSLALRFTVKPVWYRSWWAFLLYFVGAVSLFGSLGFAYIARRERNRMELEQQARLRLQDMVQVRTHEITQQKELLEAQTLEIQSANAELLYANNELKSLNIELKEANAFKTRMISIVSHDLKNPLGSMLGLSKILEAEIQNEEQRSMAHDVGELAAQMLALVKDLLDSAAIESGKLEIQKLPVDMSELITAIVWQYRPIAAKKEQEIILSIEAQCIVEGEQRRLWQVFENLVSNAIKYSPYGKKIWITLERCPKSSSVAASANGCVRFSVRDEGPGLTHEDMSKAFGHFQKLSAKPTAGESSSGVGLAIAKQITELHGGRIWIESAVGNGATFIVELPAVEL